MPQGTILLLPAYHYMYKGESTMKIALINENSQAAKNSMICENLKKIVEPMGHEVFNYGMYTAEDETQLTLSLIHISSIRISIWIRK